MLGLGYAIPGLSVIGNAGVGVPASLADLQPAQTWDGTAGSGFASTPADPVRSTAKPALRLLTPPNQHFTSSLTVGALAAANEAGSLANTLGVEKVIFHFEGSTAEVSAPKWQAIPTERGTRFYFGWWVNLRKIMGLNGSGNLYIEAIARDTTMQNRVIGPFLYTSADARHDLELTIEPSQVVVAGSRYQDIPTAAEYARVQGAQNPLLTIMEAGTFDIGDNTVTNYGITGYLNIRAGVPGVVIGRDIPYDIDDASMRNQDMPLHLAGSNLTIDFQNFENITGQTTQVRKHWIDGVEMAHGGPQGKDTPLYGAQMHFNSGRILSLPYFTEVTATSLAKPFVGAELVRGCKDVDCGNDIASDARCVVHSTSANHNNTYWNTEVPAIQIDAYTGPETNATLTRTGGPKGNNGGVYELTLGATTYTFDVGTAAFYPQDVGALKNGRTTDGYWFRDVVAWLNSFEGVSASTLLAEVDDRPAHTGSLTGEVGVGFADLDLVAGSSTLVSFFDVHGDWYQHSVGELENVILAFNRVYGFDEQLIFLSPFNPGSGAADRDVLIFGNLLAVNAGMNPTSGYCQLGRAGSNVETSHVFVAQNTFANQGWRINSRNGGLIDGSYCGFVNNTMPVFVWDDAEVANMLVDKLHLQNVGGLPNGATQVSFGGNETTLFADIAVGDFTPLGDLLENGFAPVLPSDLNRADFPAIAAVGGMAADAAEYVPSSGSGSATPEPDLIAMMETAGGQSGYYYMEDTVIAGDADTPDRTANNNPLRSGSSGANPSISAAGALFDGNDLLVTDIAGGTFTVAISWSRSGTPTGAVFAGAGGSPQVRSQDGDVVTPLPVNVTVIDGETQTLCTNRDQLFDTLNATTGEVVVYIEGFDMTGKAWLGIGRGSGTCPMLVRKAAIIDEGDYSSADLDLARLLAQEAVIS